MFYPLKAKIVDIGFPEILPFSSSAKAMSVRDRNEENVVVAQFKWRKGPTGMAVTCRVIVYGKHRTHHGRGSAGGNGYHKESAALGDAIDNAGFELYGDVYGDKPSNKRAYINGVGERAMREALLAVAKAATGKRVLTIKEN